MGQECRKKHETNEQFVSRLMNFGCPTGALIQPFILMAIEHYAKTCIEAGPKTFESGLLCGEGWIATAKHALKEVEKHLDRDPAVSDREAALSELEAEKSACKQG